MTSRHHVRPEKPLRVNGGIEERPELWVVIHPQPVANAGTHQQIWTRKNHAPQRHRLHEVKPRRQCPVNANRNLSGTGIRQLPRN